MIPMSELQWACELFASVEDFSTCECDCAIDLTNDEHVVLVEAALAAASDQLAILSGHQIRGVCAEEVSVCVNRCGCRSSCGCTWKPIVLPGKPIRDVCSVTFEGYVFDAADFVIVDGIGIAWSEASTESWPWGETVTVSYTFGRPVDEIARKAALELACPVVRACITTARSLGQGVEAVNREGVTIARRAVSSTADVAQRAASDNPWLAKFLTLYNPTRATFGASVYSPDLDEVHVIRTV